MLLNKTEKARAALAHASSAALSPHQRRILILTDGKRTLNDVMTLLGKNILTAVDGLIREGYIAEVALPEQAPIAIAQRARGLGSLLRTASDAVQSRVEQTMFSANPTAKTLSAEMTEATVRRAIPTQPVTATATSLTRAHAISHLPAATTDSRSDRLPKNRRSLAASKMYVLDMLQLRRDVRMAECRSEIQCAQDEVSTAVALLDGVRQLLYFTGPSYGQRVLGRLGEILPEEFLPALCALESELTGRPVLAVNNLNVA